MAKERKSLHPLPARELVKPKRKPDPERWTEPRVFGTLRGPFPDGAYVRIPQVRNGTGFQGQTRTADALIVSCWPSHGIWFAGVEIKVSRGDWKRELASPDKSIEIQQYCDYWYVAAPAGVVPILELPPTWGLIECTGRGCTIVKRAPKLKPKPLSATFVAAILRGSAAGYVPLAEVNKRQDEAIEQALKWRGEHAIRDLARLQESVDKFEKETGVNVRHQWNFGSAKKALELVSKSNGDLSRMIESVRNTANCNLRTLCEVLALCDAAESPAATVDAAGDDC